MSMKLLLQWMIICFCCVLPAARTTAAGRDSLIFFPADDPHLQYTGRIDFSNPQLPRFWAPGVYIRTVFEGPDCELLVYDEVQYGNSHNYIEIVVDNQDPVRIKMTGRENHLIAAKGLANARHDLIICKGTESGIGYIEFAGLSCRNLLDPPPKPIRKIECIGNSITCGSGSNLTTPCGTGQWYDQHDAYMSYGAKTARLLNAQWQLTAVSGIGLIHSCCSMTINMPQVFDKMNQRNDSLIWNFSIYQPDVVTICLGQNDGKQDSIVFCSRYILFIQQIRRNYPNATIFCLNSPMADDNLNTTLKNYISVVVNLMNARGENKLYAFFFSKRYQHGCGGHPDLQEHQEIAVELSGAIKKVMNW